LAPLGTTLRRAGVSADLLTVLGLVISVAATAVIGAGWLGLGAFVLALSAVPDVLDGAVAKASGSASPRGAFFDSVVDRVADSLVLGGFAWYLASTRGPHAALLPLALLGASSVVSYERAKAESLGFTARGGIMERAERMLALGASLLFSPFMMVILWAALVLTCVTAGQRFVMVWRQASAPPKLASSKWARGGAALGSVRFRRGWRPGETHRPRAPRSKRHVGAGEDRVLRPPPGTWRRDRTRP
ncbi:MAG: CDP-alcohol phosphatidyltransferase family protein, partial [Pseudonocardiaceae bacterium]